MYGRHHSEESRLLMSKIAKDRFAAYKKASKSKYPTTMDEFIKDNPVVKEYIDNIIKEEINKFIMVTKARFLFALKLVSWFIFAFIMWTIISNLLSQPSSVGVALGVVLFLVCAGISVWTSCFTNIGWKKDKKETTNN